MIDDPGGAELDVEGEVIYWHGPAPHHFVAVPDEESALIREVSSAVTYGWGMVPVTARLRGTSFSTSLFPKDGGYLIPLKDTVRSAEGVTLGDTVSVVLTLPAAR